MFDNQNALGLFAQLSGRRRGEYRSAARRLQPSGSGTRDAACQVNNLVLIRGMIGRSGCGVIQSNGQPTAQNTRETGCDGEFPGFRNWQNPQHMKELADVWNVDPLTIPHWAPKTHAMKPRAKTTSTRN